MSKAYSAYRKRKKSRKKRMSTARRQDILFRSIQRNFGEEKVPAGLKSAKLIPLMERLQEGTCRMASAVALIKGKYEVGTVGELIGKQLGLLPVLVKSQRISLPEATTSKASSMLAVRRGSLVELYDPNANTRYLVNPKDKIIASGLEVVVLPADMRKWGKQLADGYLFRQASMGKQSKTASMSMSKSRSSAYYHWDALVKINKLRSTNLRPGKAQLRKIKKEREEQDKIEFSTEYSLDQ